MTSLKEIKDYQTSTGSAFQVFPKLCSNNYFSWSANMESVLRSLNQWKVVMGTYPLLASCNIFTLLLISSQFTRRTWTRYVLSVVFLVTGMSVIVKSIVAYLKLWSHACVRYRSQWISDKSILLRLPLLYPFCPQVHPIFCHISDTPLLIPVPFVSSFVPVFPCFIDICSHVAMILSSLAYSLLTMFLSFLVSH